MKMEDFLLILPYKTFPNYDTSLTKIVTAFYPSLSSMVSLIPPLSFYLFHLLVQHSRYPQFPGPDELGLILINGGSCGSREVGPLYQVSAQ